MEWLAVIQHYLALITPFYHVHLLNVEVALFAFSFLVSSSIETINFSVQSFKCLQMYGAFLGHFGGHQINVLA